MNSYKFSDRGSLPAAAVGAAPVGSARIMVSVLAASHAVTDCCRVPYTRWRCPSSYSQASAAIITDQWSAWTCNVHSTHIGVSCE